MVLMTGSGSTVCLYCFANSTQLLKNRAAASVRFRRESLGGRHVKLKTFSACQKNRNVYFTVVTPKQNIIEKKTEQFGNV